MLLVVFELLQEEITVRASDANLGPQLLLTAVFHMGPACAYACWLALQLILNWKASSDACMVWSTMSLHGCHRTFDFQQVPPKSSKCVAGPGPAQQ